MHHWPEYRWRATYETAKGTVYYIEDSELEECPASYIGGPAAELVASLALVQQLREATGEIPLPSVKLWPVRLIDAARLVRVEDIKIHNARIEAEESERE